jgi:hypothetical protein
MNPIQRAEYLKAFTHHGKPNLRSAALEEARKNRTFEIDLYWKRAGYFWLFIAAAFGGYATLQNHQILSLLTACAGFLFSLAWYFVNRGSKYWQENWELHVDLLEDCESGPLYKTVVQRSQENLFGLGGPYPFSVSKINQIMSLFVTIIWLLLIGRVFCIEFGLQSYIHTRPLIFAIAALTVAAAVMLFRLGRTRNHHDDEEIPEFFQRKRAYK